MRGHHAVVAEGQAVIIFEPETNTYFFHGRVQTDQLRGDEGESVLNRVKENSFVSSLRKRIGNGGEHTSESANDE